MTTRFVIIGGGPAGNQAATYAARLGAEVTLVERDIVGGAAHLWDCIPSKAMIATGGAMSFIRRAQGMGLDVDGELDRRRRSGAASTRIEERLHSVDRRAAGEPGRAADQGTGALEGPARGRGRDRRRASRSSRPTRSCCRPAAGPASPTGASPDGERVLTTRDAYPPPQIPEHLVVIGSGVTGVEFVHMFSSLGSKVTLIVSRQQVLPHEGSRGRGRARGRLPRARRACC